MGKFYLPVGFSRGVLVFWGFGAKVYILDGLGWWLCLCSEKYVVLVGGYLEKTMVFMVFGQFGI